MSFRTKEGGVGCVDDVLGAVSGALGGLRWDSGDLSVKNSQFLLAFEEGKEMFEIHIDLATPYLSFPLLLYLDSLSHPTFSQVVKFLPQDHVDHVRRVEGLLSVRQFSFHVNLL